MLKPILALSILAIFLASPSPAVAGEVTATPGSLGFGSVLVGQSTCSLVNVTNTGSSSTVDGGTLVGGNDDQFTAFGCSMTELGLDDSCVIQACFFPTSAGAKTTTLQINDDDGNTDSVNLSGTGITTTTTTTTTTLPAPAIESFQCYKAKDLKNPKFAAEIGISLVDLFGSSLVDVTKLALLCTPVDKNGSGISDPATHQCCYKTKSPKLAAPFAVEVDDDFGVAQVEIKKAGLLCQPCSATVLP